MHLNRSSGNTPGDLVGREPVVLVALEAVYIRLNPDYRVGSY